ncbi:uncharacterized protein TNIN_248291 [Trichonephila inaurata madagascariensis]|uniref:Uncharacterized protein n=1 Tax=Trichonephila inaurata madagascariensis TaxID=2747483 RepID=A0A8X7CI31_9ARAC|nr:uncharacterized protein TNIN_248291 [Trichonephila inaurata madagascariensis]
MAGIGVMELTNSQNTIDSTSTYNSELNADEGEALRFRQSWLKFLNNGDFYKLPKVEYAESRLLDARNTDMIGISNHDQYAKESETLGSNEFAFSNTNDIHEFSEDSMPTWYEKFCGIPFKDAIERDDPFLPSTISTTDDSLAPSHNYLTESKEWIEKFDSILESYEDTKVFI